MDCKFSASVNLETKEISIKKQFAFESGDEFVYLTPMKWNENGSSYDEIDEIIGHISDGNIVFEEYDILGLPSTLTPGTFYGPLFGYSNSMTEIPTFKYKSDEWEYLGEAEFTDGWMKYNYTDSVSIHRNISDPNLLCLINPYGKDSKYKDENELDTPGYVLVDVNDPECVLVNQYVFSGFKASYVECVYPFNKEFAYQVAGYSLEEIKEAYSSANKEISHVSGTEIIINNCMFGQTQDPVAHYIWQDAFTNEPNEMIAKIKMPEGWKVSIVAKSISLNKTELSLEKGQSETLSVSIMPDNVDNASVKWSSSDNNIAIVTEDGIVTAVAGGQCEITATTHNGISAKCNVVVKEMPESITFDKNSADIKMAEKLMLLVSITPESTTERELTFTSSNDEVVEILETLSNNSVFVKGLKAGTATITAKAVNGITATCDIVVHQIPETISVDLSETVLKKGDTLQLNVMVGPETAEDKSVSWYSSNDEVASVSSEGLVTANKCGSVLISAKTINGLEATCSIEVIQLVERIILDQYELNAIEGEKIQLIAIVEPEDATNKILTWSSNNTDVAIVEETGFVSVIKEGNCIIYAKSTDGSDISAECVVTSTSGIDGIYDDAIFDIYNLQGTIIKNDANREDLKKLTPGLYIVRDGAGIRKIIIH